MAEPIQLARSLVINDGSLGALVAAAVERDRGAEVIAWIPPVPSGLCEPGYGPSGVAAMVRHQGAVLGYEQTVEFLPPGDAHTAQGSGIDTTILLLEAARAAVANACTRILWPIVLGDDLRAMSWADERAEFINRLLLIDLEAGSGRGVELILPLVDLSPGQVEDLAADLGVPRHLCAGPVLAGR